MTEDVNNNDNNIQAFNKKSIIFIYIYFAFVVFYLFWFCFLLLLLLFLFVVSSVFQKFKFIC